MAAHACEWCRESIDFLDAQTSSGRAHGHTRRWSETAEEQSRLREEADDNEASLTMDRWSRPETERSEETEDMATAPQRTPREVVDFPPNVPVTVALRYPQGKTVSGQYGERVMFTLTDGRVMFLDPEVAGRIESLGISVRESFTIARCSTGQKGASVTWDIARIVGEQPNGTFVLQAPDTSTPEPPASAAISDGGIPRKPVGSALVDEANALVDSFAQVLERSLTVYQGRIKPDEVKSLVVTAYIQRQKLSSVA